MSIRTSPWPFGVPCWADLSTADVEAAKAFYSAVIGWTFQEGDEEFGGYVIAQSKSAAAAGIGPQQPGAPVAWTLYIAADDADAVAASVREQGGTVVMAPGDVGPLGRMFIAADPTGAAFGVWQAGTMIGAEVVNEGGGISWEDLRTPDPDRARAFYSAVFGYRYEAIPMAGEDYTVVLPAGEGPPLGGLGGMMGMQAAPFWLVYFGVADAEASVTTANNGGGTVLSPAFETPFGKMATLADPAGAVFNIIENTGQATPDREG